MEDGHVILVGFYFSPSEEEEPLLNGEEVAQDPIFKFDLYGEQEPWSYGKHLKQKRKEAVIQSEPEPGKYFVMFMVGRSMVVCGSCLSFILINCFSFPTSKYASFSKWLADQALQF